MAERRMFAKTIIDSDAFLDLPPAAQLLYFHLAMRTDDDGFVNKPKSVLRLIGCAEEDQARLAQKQKEGDWKMGKWEVPEHPEVDWVLRTGYPSWMQERD